MRLAEGQEGHVAPGAGQQVRVHLCQQPAVQSLAAIGPPLPAGRIAAAAVHLCQPRIAGRVVGPGRAWGLGAIGVIEAGRVEAVTRSEEHTSELQSLMRSSYAVFCLTKKNRGLT